MKQERFERIDDASVFTRPRPHKCNLPIIHLAIRNDVAARACQMAANAGANPIDRLAHINRYFIQIAQRVDTGKSRQ